MEQVVYMIKNNRNKRVYFGVTQELEKRRRSHINMLRSNSHNNHDLQKDWNTFGEEAFSWAIIKTFDKREDAEELEIKLINESTKPYNVVKDRSVGGDYFTHNPRKEELREVKREQMTGENNHQYGKPKTKKMIESVKKANSKVVKIENKVYPSISEASRILGIGETTIAYRLKAKSERFKDWNYL